MATLYDALVGEAVGGAEALSALGGEFHPLITPAAALTAVDDSTVDGTYGAEEAAVLANVVTRQGEIEAALVAAGILTEAEGE